MWIYINERSDIEEKIFNFEHVKEIFLSEDNKLGFNIGPPCIPMAVKPKNQSLFEIFEYLNAVNVDSPENFILDWDSIEWEDQKKERDYERSTTSSYELEALTELLQKFIASLEVLRDCKEV